ncbi:hypothetical protein LBMAG15_16700 [Actinomycetes bacterium]|nr:hypothetical protein LBMAG15_16700 [Actinomycetes bacterium]
MHGVQVRKCQTLTRLANGRNHFEVLTGQGRGQSGASEGVIIDNDYAAATHGESISPRSGAPLVNPDCGKAFD